MCDPLKRSPRDVGLGGAAGHTPEQATRVGVPVGRAEPCERRHHDHPFGVLDGRRQRLDLMRRDKEAEVVAEPLHHGACDEGGALERIDHGGLPELPSGGRDQPVTREDRLRAGVHEQEGAGSVGALGLSDFEAGLPEEGRLLVAGHACDGDAVGQKAEAAGHAVSLGACADAGQDGAGDAEQVEHLVVPVAGRQRHEHGAGGVGDIGHMGRAACEPPDEEGVDGAEGQLSAVGGVARAGYRVEDPGRLGAREVGVENQAGACANELLMSRLSKRGTGVSGAAALPDDGVVDGHSCGAVPDDRRLTLVGDADRGDAAR